MLPVGGLVQLSELGDVISPSDLATCLLWAESLPLSGSELPWVGGWGVCNEGRGQRLLSGSRGQGS
jgi:hypothetical protein